MAGHGGALSGRGAVTRRMCCATALAAPFGATLVARAQPGGTLRVRTSALSLAPDDAVFTRYAAAVKAMHALPPDDPRSWRKQAEIHARFCTHASPLFLPWHRHYVSRFEAICGQLIGDPAFALPYWDWTVAGGKIPDPFFDIRELDVAFWSDSGVGTFSPGWGRVDTVGSRSLVKGQRMQDDPRRGAVFTAMRIAQIKRTPSYDRFVGQLETQPHNTGHIVTGGSRGHMSSGLSPLDPLFWLHHCNVDRLWAEWQLAGNRTPRFAATFARQFVDATGEAVTVDADGATDFQGLGFTYDTIASFGSPRDVARTVGVEAAVALGPDPDAKPPAAQPLGSASLRAAVGVGTVAGIPVRVSGLAAALGEGQVTRDATLPAAAAIRAFRGRPEEALARFGREVRSRRRVYALVAGATVTGEGSPTVNVFLNCPYLSPETPDRDEHYAGSFTFFGHAAADHGGGHGHGTEFLVDITDAIERLGLGGLEELQVQLVPVEPEAGGRAAVRADTISIVAA
ncbi:MAG: tyrosinase family protein [Planctomycetia bacterium]|nr:tyrosinase family protein [Planctomycetia bacterium]